MNDYELIAEVRKVGFERGFGDDERSRLVLELVKLCERLDVDPDGLC